MGRNLANRNFSRAKRPAVTKEELDKELDEYMKKGKHPQIDVSDLKWVPLRLLFWFLFPLIVSNLENVQFLKK